MEQNVFSQRAIDSVNEALRRLGPKADRNNITLWGHSVGGLIALCWSSESRSAKPKNIVLANACVDMSAGAPVGPQPIPLDWETKAASTICPVIILTGNDDTIAKPDTAEDIFYALVNAPAKAVYQFFTDNHGDPELKADHMAPLCDDGIIPSFIMDMIGGDAEVDSTAYRFYWAAIDAALNEDIYINFDMGSWSDGVPVREVTRVLP